MLIFGATVVVVDHGRVLLRLREGRTTWCLPRGAGEAGASLARRAVPEVGEETGSEAGPLTVLDVCSWARGIVRAPNGDAADAAGRRA